ncbi:MAG: hypothetical protein EOO16_12245 [Chitinophagaceae bacterium]|nr:MAG: hypothetical protein EOO16_12245 [Chitinophagaceae bacterium]
MRKAILILALCLLGIANSNTASAQTKEETISWLKEKLAKHFKQYQSGCRIGCSFTLLGVEVNECEIKYKVDYWWGYEGGTTEGYTYIIPTQDLTIEGGVFYLNYEGIAVSQTSTRSKRQNYVGPGRSYKIRNMENVFGINTSGEVDIQERIQKALTHLASFCPPKKKEAF